MPDNFAPSTIRDPLLGQVVSFLMNLVEVQAAEIQAQAQQIQQLRDEINHLKREQEQDH